MSTDFPQIPVSATNTFEAVTAATASSTKGLQAVATEMTDYSKKSFEKSRAHFEKLVGVKNVNEAIQLQSDFARFAYEDFVAEATKISGPLFRPGQGSLHADEKIGRGPSSRRRSWRQPERSRLRGVGAPLGGRPLTAGAGHEPQPRRFPSRRPAKTSRDRGSVD